MAYHYLSYHLKENDQVCFDSVLEICYNSKQSNRNCDRREALLTPTVYLDGKVSNKILRLLKTLTEIQRIIYLKENERTTREILRLHNVCFQHFIMLRSVIGFRLKKLTSAKLYGKYMHNVMAHAPTQLRIISGQSINCEGEELFFNTIKSITDQTTSYRPGHIIGNYFVQQEIEDKCKY